MTSRDLDQFYTKESISLELYNISKNYITDFNDYDIILEPSAGSGSFFKLFPEKQRLGLDIEPKFNDIVKQDFFEFKPNPFLSYITIGNPPFGKNASLAIKFFNKCSEFSNYICFVVPKTFRKVSLHNKLSLNMHLIYDKELPENSFIFNDNPYNVPCCFQIWQKATTKRKIIPPISYHTDFERVDDVSLADFIFQRVGARAGTLKTDNLLKWGKTSHYYIRSKIDKQLIISRFNELNFDEVKYNTAGNPSISYSEIIRLYTDRYT